MEINIFQNLYQNVEMLKGIGEKKKNSFINLGIQQCLDILFVVPSKIIDRTQDINLAKLEKGQIITTIVKVVKHRPPFNSRLPYVIECSKGSMIINIIYFALKGNYLRTKYPLGEEFIISGKLSFYKSNISIAHPDYVEEIENESSLRSFETVYPLTRGISLKDVKKVLKYCLENFPKVEEWIPENLIKKHNFYDFHYSLLKIHKPDTIQEVENVKTYRRRLAFDELISNYFAIRYLKEVNQKKESKNALLEDLQIKLTKELPFELTDKQKSCLEEINNLNKGQYRETILLQGDVGSGKTVIALLSAMPFIQSDYQVAYMAPTEILAIQIFNNLSKLFLNSVIKPVLLTGSSKNKEEIQLDIKNNKFNFIIGTHALFQNNVTFKKLGFAIIDEQHRFGVQQRLALSEKGINPNILIMSATPIPRTLALAQYGEIEQVILDQRPSFQKEIITRVAEEDKIKDLIDYLKKHITEKKQAYWICPLVEESEKLPYQNVEKRFKILEKIFKNRIGLVHGKMSIVEKESVINKFNDGLIEILVATTVVEVGIDNKNADYIVIENAEKFGLSQLHQLRGRIGRGSNQGYCFATHNKEISENGKERMDIFKNYSNGFDIADKDMQLRGTGDILGLRQSGDAYFKFVNVLEDQDIIIESLDFVKEQILKEKYKEDQFKKKITPLLHFFKQQEAIKLLFS
ncbi:MAG: ATP-dependent DNA helicase RecG [Proteobacteria bacterium]|nr:ATP-dependent DNA helicase RecG [Pseudomonadota bacterium]